jgi:hypothetical protein
MPWQTSTLGGVPTPETADRLWLETRPSGREMAGELLDSMGASQGQRLHSVSDHTYFDLVVDPQRSAYMAGPRLARALSWLLPKPDLAFLLDSEPDVLGHQL